MLSKSLAHQYHRYIQAPLLRNKLVLIGGGFAVVGCAALFSTFIRRTFFTRVTMAHPGSSIGASTVGGIKELSPSKDLLSSLSRYRVVDVREPAERVDTGYVPTSVNVPLQTVLDGTAVIPEDKPLLMVCRSGKRSLRAAETLQSRGYTNLTNLAGGTLGWIEAGLPVDHVTPQAIKEVFPSKDLERQLSSFTIIDVREPFEREETGFVPGSINVPLATVLDGSGEIPQEKKPLLIVCRSGKRSMKAAETLASRGLDCTNLATGTLGWIENWLTVEKIKH